MLRSILSMSAATSLSRITGFLRTMTQAATLGTGAIAGAYTLSNALPTQIYELFMGGLLSSILVPLLIERLARRGAADARAFINALLTLISPLLALLALLGIIFAEPIILLTTDWASSPSLDPGEATRRIDLAVLLFRVFALQIVFYGAGALATGILNAHRRFFLPTFAPVLNNLAVILSFGIYAILAGRSPEAAIYTLAVGTTLGVAIMSLMLVPPAVRLGYKPELRIGHPALASAARLAAPVLIFVAATVAVQVAANLFASRSDGVDELYYAFIIFLLPYGIFVVSIVTALVPELSEKFSQRDPDGYRSTLSFGLRTTLFVTIPALVALATLAVPIVGLLYERGEFGAGDTQLVATVLVAFAVGLPGYAVQLMLVRSFYARQNSMTPAVLNVGLFVVFVALSYFLSNAFGLSGVALGFSAAYTLLAIALLFAMRQQINGLQGWRLARSLSKILVAGIVMYAVASVGLTLTGPGSSFIGRTLVVGAVGGAAIASYVGIAFLLGAEELRSIISALSRQRANDGPLAGRETL
ncbi:murein biosynthesis integral membrane protein MurJ [soil metagenome]